MFKDKTLPLRTLQDTTINTAKKRSSGDQSLIKDAFFGTVKNVFLPSLTPISPGQENRGVFSEELNSNLGSVGRICDNDLLIVFSKEKYFILPADKTEIYSQVLHTQERDPNTGFYLTEKESKSVSPHKVERVQIRHRASREDLHHQNDHKSVNQVEVVPGLESINKTNL